MAKSKPTPDEEIFELTDIVSKGDAPAPKNLPKSDAAMLEESLSDLFSGKPQDNNGDASADLDLDALLAEIEVPDRGHAPAMGVDPSLDDIFDEIMADPAEAENEAKSEADIAAAKNSESAITSPDLEEVPLADIDALLASIDPPGQPDSATPNKPAAKEISLDEIDSIMDDIIPVEKVEGFFAPDKAKQEARVGTETDLEDLDDILNSILDPSAVSVTDTSPMPEFEEAVLVAEPEEVAPDDLFADLDDLFASLDQPESANQAAEKTPVAVPAEALGQQAKPAAPKATPPVAPVPPVAAAANIPAAQAVSAQAEQEPEEDILVFGEMPTPSTSGMDFAEDTELAFVEQTYVPSAEPDEKVMALVAELAELSDNLTKSLSYLEGRVSTLESAYADTPLSSNPQADDTESAFEEKAVALLAQGHAFREALSAALQSEIVLAPEAKLSDLHNPSPALELGNLEDRISTLEMAFADTEKEMPGDTSALEAKMEALEERLTARLAERLADMEEKNRRDNKAILDTIEKAAAEAAARVIREEILALMAEEN